MSGVLASAQTPATTQSLGGTAGQAHGFTVTATGLGADSFNVGADGAAFGVKNNTTLNVYELLKSVDRQVVNGVLYNGDKTLRNEATDLFDAQQGGGDFVVARQTGRRRAGFSVPCSAWDAESCR
jgi:hypothetical protein